MPDILTRTVAPRANSYDPATRTFEAVIATAAPVRRRAHLEVLDLAGADLPDSLPIQLDHRTDVQATVGRMSDFQIVGDELRGRGRLSSDPEVAWIGHRIADGTLANMSVGFRVARWRDGRGEAGARTRTATAWEPVEASFVMDPADRRAKIRSNGMADETETIERPEAETEETAERRTIRRAAEALGVEDDDLGDEPETARRAALDQIRRRTAPAAIRPRHDAETLDNPDVYRRAAVASIVGRIVGEEAKGPARELQAAEWDDFHKQHLRRAGVSTTGLSRSEIIVRALTTSDMPLIAGEAFNQSVRRTYEAAASPITALLGSRAVPDFRPWRDVLVDWTTLKVEKVGEHGEFKHSYISETGETYSVFTIGGLTGVTRQLYVNGVQSMGSLSRLQGRALAADVADRTVAYIEQASGAGPKMSDGKAVFHADRGNIETITISGGPIGIVEDMLAARAKMPRRKGAGDVAIGVLPSLWLVSPEFEPTALKAVAQVQASAIADVNPLAGKLQVVAEPRLSAAARSYLVAAPATMDGMVKVGLEGAGGPMTESRWGFEVDALQFKIRLDLGFGWVEWRSWTRMDHA